MGIVNKRNAIIGWVVVKAGKRAVKKKAQSAAPAAKRTGGAAAAALATLGGMLFFWRRKRGGSPGRPVSSSVSARDRRPRPVRAGEARR